MTSLVGRRPVVLLGDTAIDSRRDELKGLADEHGRYIIGVYTFEPGEAAGQDELTDVDAVMAALGRAIKDQADIWVPWVIGDLGREQHIRRMILVLDRHGRCLRVGKNLSVLKADGGLNEIDYALRTEVRAVDNLDNAVLAALGAEKLHTEIERALAVVSAPDRARVGDEPDGTAPVLPAPGAPWPQRHSELKRYATWLVQDCGVTQAATARVLNSTGQRTPTGRLWQPATVSKLVNGRYDRSAVRG